MPPDYRVISIGALAAHPLWEEKGDARPGHATTTVVRSGDAVVLIDPSLPPKILEARLDERTGLEASRITHVFLTCLSPLHRRGIALFDEAQWLVCEAEREAVGVHLVGQYREAEAAGDHDLMETLRAEIALVQRMGAAPDRLADGIDLFPLPGVTPGLAGLLISTPTATTVVCGDAIPTVEHLEAGRMHAPCHDLEKARESFSEAVEIADLLVLGRDNLVVNPIRRL
jgi:glyoxylase-like metal-dependent hydrolase (beta-lactamase superfamily II)